MQTNLHIEPSVKPLFAGQELDSFDALMKGGAGKIQRMVLNDGSKVYLKRSTQEPLAKHLRTLLYGQRPRSAALRERLLLQRLRSSGFLAMEPVAWGERRRLGLPACGFLIVREVVGQEVSELFDQADGWEKRVLMKEIGRLIGRLHVKGFFHPVRLKDMIYTEAGIVLIDRETSKPWRSLFLKKKCSASLARAFRRTARDGHRIGAGSTGAFLRGYRERIAPRWNVPLIELSRLVFGAVRKEMSN